MYEHLVLGDSVFHSTMLVEWKLTKTRCHRIRTGRFGNLSMGIGNLPHDHGQERRDSLFMAVYEFRLFDLPVYTWWVWPRRSQRKISRIIAVPTRSVFWGSPRQSLSSQTFNLSTALRQSWTTPFVSWVFWLPLPLLGFHPAIVIAQAMSLCISIGFTPSSSHAWGRLGS